LLGAARKNPRGASLHSSLLGTRISKTLRAARGGGGHGCILSILVACSGVRQYSTDDIVCERGSRDGISLMILMCRAMICGMSCRNLWRSLVPGAGSFPLMKCVLHFCTWQLPPIPGPLMNVMLGNSLQWESRNVEFVVIRDYQIDPDDKVLYLIFDSLQTPTRCLCLRNCNHVLCSPQLQPDVLCSPQEAQYVRARDLTAKLLISLSTERCS